MAADAEIFVDSLRSVSGVIVMAIDTDLHIESFRKISLTMSGYFSQRAPHHETLDHDLGVTVSTSLSDPFFVYRRQWIVMIQDDMFGVTVVTQREFLADRHWFILKVNIFLVFFRFFWMASSTIHIDETFSEMQIGASILMTIHTDHLAFLVDILRPLFGIHVKRPGLPISHNLEDIGFSMTFEAFLVGIERGLSRKANNRKNKNSQQQEMTFFPKR
jgi:hypothetical protein